MKFGDLRISFLKPSLTYTIISHMCHDIKMVGEKKWLGNTSVDSAASPISACNYD